MNYEEALVSAKNGNAVLFYGAGFTYGLESYAGYKAPNGTRLAEILCEEANINSTDNLKVASRNFRRVKTDEELIELLRQYFIFDRIPETYNAITTTPWHSIYTTNYDNSFEVSALQNKIPYTSLVLTDNPKNFHNQKFILHINGSIDKLTKSDLETSFKLTNVSYLTAHFRDNKWAEVFRRDLQAAEAIFFVGYSLYDLDIQEIIFDIGNLKSKIFFIDKPGLSEEEIENSELSDFGLIKSIGVEKFANDLDNVDENLIGEPSKVISSFEQLEFNIPLELPKDEDVFDLYLKGYFQIDYIYQDIVSVKENYVFHRDIFTAAISCLNDKENLIITGGLANGKTILSYQLLAYLKAQGYTAFQLKDEFVQADAFIDITKILKENVKTVFFIENYTSVSNLDVISHIETSRHEKVKLILTARTFEHEKYHTDLYFNKKIINVQNTREINTDELTHSDLSKIVKSFAKQGIWPEKINSYESSRIRHLKTEANSQFHGVLVRALNSPQIKDRLNSFYNEMLKSDLIMKNITAIMCFSLSNVSKPSFHNVAAVTKSNAIFEPAFTKSVIFQTLVSSKGDNSILSKSSILAQFFLKNFPTPKLLVETIIEIAKNSYSKSTYNQDFYMNFYRFLAAFRNIQTLLPDRGRRELLIDFYEGLKRSVEDEIKNPQFWLQYAIARLSFPTQDNNNLELAKKYLDTALQIAKARKGGYWTDDIETQMARYFFYSAISVNYSVSQVDEALNSFNEGVNLLVKVSNNKDRMNREIFRPMKEVHGFYTRYNSTLKGEVLERFKLQCLRLKEIIDKNIFLEESEENFNRAKTAVEYILKSIELRQHVEINN